MVEEGDLASLVALKMVFFNGGDEQLEVEEGRGYKYPPPKCSRLCLQEVGLSGLSEAGLSGFRIIRPLTQIICPNNPGEPEARAYGDFADFWR